MTVVDWWGVTDRVPNVNYMTEVEADRLYALLAERLVLLP